MSELTLLHTFISGLVFGVGQFGHLSIVVDTLGDGFVELDDDAPAVDGRGPLGLGEDLGLQARAPSLAPLDNQIVALAIVALTTLVLDAIVPCVG